MVTAHYRFDNLTILLDFSHLQIDGPNGEVIGVDSPMAKYESSRPRCFRVDSHNVNAITQVLKASVFGKPKSVCYDTHKGQGASFVVDQFR